MKNPTLCILLVLSTYVQGQLNNIDVKNEMVNKNRYSLALGIQKVVYYDEWLSYNYFKNTGLRPTSLQVEKERTNSRRILNFYGVYHILRPNEGIQYPYSKDKVYLLLIDINYSYLYRLKSFKIDDTRFFIGPTASINGLFSLRDYQYNWISGASISHELKPFELGLRFLADYSFKNGHFLNLSAYSPLLFVNFETYVPLTLAAERKPTINCIGKEYGVSFTISYIMQQERSDFEIFYSWYLRSFNNSNYKQLMVSTLGINLIRIRYKCNTVKV